MAKTAILSVRILGDSKDAVKSTEDAGRSIGKLEKGLNAVTPAATVAVGGVLAFAKVTSDAAADAEQNIGAVGTVFGQSATMIEEWAKSADDAVGLSASSYNELAASIGGSLRTAGYSMDETASKTNDMIQAAADLSSVFGGDTAEAAGAMGAALRGQFDPLERFGVFMTMNAVNARLAAAGQDKLTGAAGEAAKKQMVNNMILEQAGQYSGNFAREADTAAGAQQRAAAATQNAKAAMGEAFLPAIVAGSRALQGFAGFAQQNAGLVSTLAIVVGGAGAAVLITNGAMKAWAATQGIVRGAALAATGAQWLWNAALSANPIGLVIIAVVGLVTLMVVAYNRVGWFRDAINGLGPVAQAIFGGINAAIAATIGWIRDAIGWFGSLFGAKNQANNVAVNTGGVQAASSYTLSDPAVMTMAASSYTLAAPATMTARSIPQLLSTATAPASAPAPQVVNTYNVTVQGAIDPRGTAKTIQDLLDRYARTQGRTAGGFG